MDLTYPPEAEQFRTEIRSWLEENLPDGWFDEGFEQTPEEKKAYTERWNGWSSIWALEPADSPSSATASRQIETA